ncbi:MAG: molybdenum cofactor biosynthesis protein MoaE [Gemmatimonadaceae bacterium]
MRVALVTQPIDLAGLGADVAHPGTGATTLFVGTVREVHAGRAVTGIDYEAYEPMAVRECETICAEAAERFGTDRIVVVHRLGTLAVTEASIAIAVAAPRRVAALEAQRYVIEAVKARVPIFKREHYVDGTRAWVDNRGGAVTADAPAPVGGSA